MCKDTPEKIYDILRSSFCVQYQLTIAYALTDFDGYLLRNFDFWEYPKTLGILQEILKI